MNATPETLTGSEVADWAWERAYGVEPGQKPQVLLIDVADPSPDDRALALIGAHRGNDILLGVSSDGAVAPSWRGALSMLDATFVPQSNSRIAEEFVDCADPVGMAQSAAAAALRSLDGASLLAAVLRAAPPSIDRALELESLAYSLLMTGDVFRAWVSEGHGHAFEHPRRDMVRIERRGDAILLTLDNPERRNSMSRQMRDSLLAGMLAATLDPEIRVKIRGAGSNFSAGGDLHEFGTARALDAHFTRVRTSVGAAIAQMEARVHVFQHGACFGAGVEIPAFAGQVTADPETTFCLPEVAMGLLPGAGGTVSVPRRIGRWRTLALALSGTSIGADQALRWGLVDHIVDREHWDW